MKTFPRRNNLTRFVALHAHRLASALWRNVRLARAGLKPKHQRRASVLPSQLKTNSFLARVLASQTLEVILVAVCLWCFLKPHPTRSVKMRQSIAGREIWSGTVHPDDWIELVAWEGTTLYKTQQVVYTQWKNREKYLERSLDNWGWVWYYDGGRKLTERQVALDVLDRAINKTFPHGNKKERSNSENPEYNP